MDFDHLVLLRLGAELTIKSKRTRSAFLRRLRRNLRAALETTGTPFRIEGEWSRIYARTSSPEALTILPRVFGISSASPIDLVLPCSLDEIVTACTDFYKDRVAGKTF